jgi:modular polyketide synthase
VTIATQEARNGLAPTDIAVVAAECRFPGINNIDQLHERLCAGEPVTHHGLAHTANAADKDPDFVPVGSKLDDIEMFDPDVFGMSTREAELLDPQARVLHELCLQALDSAGHGFGRGIDNVGVILGGTHSAFLHALFPDFAPLGGANPVETMEVSLGTYLDYLANSVAHRLSLTGPAFTVQTACSTSLVAVHLGISQLLAQESDMVLVGGATVHTPQESGYTYVPDGPFSEDGLTCPYSESASGAVFTQGAGVVALRRAHDAVADGDPILAIIRGSAVNNDGGRSVGLVAPSAAAHAEVIHQAQAMADVEPQDISYLEGHGTGTKVGDPLEISAMVEVFGHSATPWCTVGSCKSVLGHTEAAAGIASLMAVIGSLRHRRIPGTVGSRKPSSAIDLHGSSLQLAHDTMAWQGINGRRIAGISSLGFGGTNCHVIVEESPQMSLPNSHRRATPAVLNFSAATKKSALAMTKAMSAWARENSESLDDAAWTLTHGRKQMPWRAALAVSADGETIEIAPPRTATKPARLIFAFPGGGAQRAGMLQALVERNETCRQLLDDIAEEFGKHVSGDIRSICAPEFYGLDSVTADDPELGLPALVAAEIVCARALIAAGVRPDAMLGHSTGEYAAAVISGSLGLEDVAPIIAARSRALAHAVPGAMIRIRGNQERVSAVLSRHRNAEISAYNSPRSTVVSADHQTVNHIAQELGDDATIVPVAVAAHSSFVDEVVPIVSQAADSLAAREPETPVFSPSLGRQVSRNDLSSQDFWAKHVRRPVQFHQTLTSAVEYCPDSVVVVNVGPGASMSALAREAGLPAITATVTVADDRGNISESSMLAAVAEVSASGVPCQSPEPDSPRRVALPPYPFDRRHFWPKQSPRQATRQEMELTHRLHELRLAPSTTEAVEEVTVAELSCSSSTEAAIHRAARNAVHEMISWLSSNTEPKGIVAVRCPNWDIAKVCGAAIYSVTAETGIRAVAYCGDVSHHDIVSAAAQSATAVRGDATGTYVEQPFPVSLAGSSSWPDPDTVVILGGSGRVGQALSRHFEKKGIKVVVGTRQEGPGHVTPTSAIDIERLLRESGCGRRGAVIVATGVVGEKAFAESKLTDFDTVTSHFEAKTDVVAAVSEACTRMEGDAPGRVLVMSSMAAHVGGVGLAAYAASNRAAECVTPPKTPTAWMTVASDGWQTGRVNSFGNRLLDNALEEHEAVECVSKLLSAPVEGTTLLTRKDIASLRRATRPDSSSAESSMASEQNSDLSARLRSLWKQTLGIEDLDVDTADFFSLGGSSLQATRLLAEVRRECGIGMRLRDLLADPSFSGMLSRVEPEAKYAPPSEDKTADSLDIKTPAKPEQWPLTPVQRAYLIGRQHSFGANSNPCHSFVETLIDAVDVDRLGQAMTTVISRHPMLRAIVTEDGHRAINPDPYVVPVVDCRNHADPEQALERWRARYSTRTAPASQWPLVTVAVAIAPDGVHLGFSIDVLVCDASSFGLFFDELSKAYAGIALPAAPTRNFAEHSRAVADGQRVRPTDRQFWEERAQVLPPAPNLGALPVSNETFDRVTWRLDEELDSQIHSRARALKVTPTVLFLTAYARTLAEHVGAEDMTVMLTVFDRPQGFEQVIGDFTTLVPCALHVGEHPDEDIRGIGESLFEVLDHTTVAGPEIVSKRSAYDGEPFRLPVVFTSTLGTQVDGGESEYRLGDLVWGASQTPQVSLDHQVYQWRGRLVAQFDGANSIFGVEGMNAFVSSYKKHLRALLPEQEMEADAGVDSMPSITDASHSTAEEICSMWRGILGDVDIEPNSTWSALGGDSLDAIRVVAALRREGIASDIDEILGGITPAALAGRTISKHSFELVRHAEGEPFPLTPLQQAYLVGSQGGWSFSHDSAHFYVDYYDPDATGESLTRAVAALIRHQPMLRAVITDDGQQVILHEDDPALANLPISVEDLSQHSEEAVEEAIADIRRTWPHEPIDPHQWPNFRVLAQMLPHGGARVHVQASLLFVDGWSFYLFFDQLFAFADNPNMVIPAPSLTFADYQVSVAQEEREKREHDAAWWRERLDLLPSPVQLPLQGTEGRGMRRDCARVSAKRAEEFFQRCREEETTPTAVIGGAWAQAVCELSGCEELLMTVLYFNRRPLAEDIDRVLGPFATTSLVHCNPRSWGDALYEGFAEQLAITLAHSAITGVEVARMLSRHRGSQEVVSPVVYTSTLGFGDGAKDATTARIDESDVYERVVTPQVLLDLQASMENGSIAINLDSPMGAFAEDVTASLLAFVVEHVDAFIDNRSPQVVLDSSLAAPAKTERNDALDALPWSKKVCSPVSLDAVTQEFLRALGHDVNDTAHFYEAGGDSLSMVRVIAGLRSRHGLSITPEEFLAQPTPSGVAAVARPQLDPDVHVLPLSDGTGEPLYLLHPSGGDVLCYMALARAIAPRPVYALADPGLDGTPMPVDLESVARCYGDVIVAHRAKLGHEGRHGLHGFGCGLFLGGWSMGGTVAQLLARTLIERGIDVRGLLLVDSNSPDRIRELTGLAETEVDAEFARRYVRSLQAFNRLAIEDSAIAAGDPVEAVSEVLTRQGLDIRDIDNRLGVFTRHLAGLARLTAQPLANVPTLLAVAGQRSPANSGVGMGVDDAVDDEFLGWGSDLPEETTVVVVPGHHYTVLSEPGLSGISERLVEMLDTIESTMGDRK